MSTEEIFVQKNVLVGTNTGDALFGSHNPNTSFEQSKPAILGFSVRTPITQPYEYSDYSGFNKNVTFKASNHGVNDSSGNLSWSTKETGWYSVLIVRSNL